MSLLALGSLKAAEKTLQRRSVCIGPAWLDRPTALLNKSAEGPKLAAGLAGGLTLIGGPAGRRAGVRGLSCHLVVSAAVDLGLKHLVQRNRPRLLPGTRAARQRRNRSTPSFPSSHAAGMAAFATGAAVELPASALPLAVVAILVGATPVRMGMHHPSDVLAGWALGCGAGWASKALIDPLPKDSAERGSPDAEG